MKNPILRDLEKWNELNTGRDFSVFDYIFHAVKDSKIHTDLFFAIIEMSWPTFIQYQGYIFLNESFSEHRFNSLEQNNRLEFWMNLLTVDSYFYGEQDEEKKAEALAKLLSEMWRAKLRIDFPNLNFTVEYICDKEYGDYGLTFYQNKTLLTPVS